MRTLLFVIILLALGGCQSNKNDIEIIWDYDSIYLSEKDVDIPPKEKGGEESFQQELESLLKSEAGKNPNRPIIYKMAFRTYINEAGVIEKIKVLDPFSFDFKIGETGADILCADEKLYHKISSVLKKYEFEPAVKNGKKVKSRLDAAYAYQVNPDGSSQGYIPFFDISLNLSSLDNLDYLIAVEEMPEPIGGIQGIQKRIVYPEIAKRAGIEGKVFVKAFIDEKGTVKKVEVLKGIGSGLDEAALSAVANTRFKPGRQKGAPVKVQVLIPVVFKLQ